MPNAIDRCASCRQPLYLEDGVAGGCGCPDRELRVLLAQQKQRNSTGNTDFTEVSPPDLSGIDPAFLLSAAGRSEFEAARQISGLVPQAVPSPPMAAPEIDLGEADEGVDFDFDGDWTGSWQDQTRHNARVASAANGMDNVDLAAMWMQGTGIPYDPSQLVSTDHLDDFQFDTGDLAVDASAYPRGGSSAAPRFRVDAAPPSRPAFNRSLVNDQGPMVESARVRNGRFPVLRERPQPQNVDVFDQVRTHDVPAPSHESRPTAPMNAMQQARQLQAKPKGPSVYDLIRNNPLRSK
jgi:hypothetical protein